MYRGGGCACGVGLVRLNLPLDTRHFLTEHQVRWIGTYEVVDDRDGWPWMEMKMKVWKICDVGYGMGDVKLESEVLKNLRGLRYPKVAVGLDVNDTLSHSSIPRQSTRLLRLHSVRNVTVLGYQY